MKFLILVLIINILNVNCGLLKELLTPVTEKVQNNELLNEHERKKEEPTKKGVLTNVVESLDSGADKLVNLLNKGNKVGKDEKVPTKPTNEQPEPTSATQKPTPKPEEIEKDVKTTPTTTTIATTPNTNSTAAEDNQVKNVTKEDTKEEDKGSVTPANSVNADVPTVESHTGIPEGNATETKTGETAEVKNK